MKVKILLLIIATLLFAACSKEESDMATLKRDALQYPDGSPKLYKVLDEQGTVEYSYNDDGTIDSELFYESETAEKISFFRSKYNYSQGNISRIDYYWEEDLQFSEYFEYNNTGNINRSYLQDETWGYSQYFYNAENKLYKVEEYYNNSFLGKSPNAIFFKYHNLYNRRKTKTQLPVLNFVTEIEYNATGKLEKISYFEADQTTEKPNLIYSNEFEFDQKNSPFYNLGFPYFSSSNISQNNIKTILRKDYQELDTTQTIIDIKYQYNTYSYPTQAIVSENEVYAESSIFEYYQH